MTTEGQPLMDLLDRFLGHDAWTTRHLLERCRVLSDAQLDQPFDLGHGSLRATFAHLIGNIEVWTALMRQQPIEPSANGQPPSVAQLLARLQTATSDFGALACRVVAEGRLDELWTDYLDEPPTQKSYGGAIAHVLTHNMAHRTEILHMLARLGLPDLIEGDLLSWEQQERNRTTNQRFAPGAQVQVTAAYQAQYADPIVMHVGDQVRVEDRPTEWSGWVWCSHLNGKQGWTPAAYLQRTGDTAVALRNYSAGELSVQVGEDLTVIDFASGWYLVTNAVGQQGWVPAEALDSAGLVG